MYSYAVSLGLADDLDQAALLEEVKKTCNVCDAQILFAWLSVGISSRDVYCGC